MSRSCPGCRIRAHCALVGSGPFGAQGCECGFDLTPDPADGEVEGTGGQERVGRLGEDAADQAAAAHRFGGAQVASSGGGAQCVLDVDRDWTAGDERKPLVVRGEDFDVELTSVRPARRPRTRARLPATRRSVSRSMSSNGAGVQRAIASGSVSRASISSGRPVTVAWSMSSSLFRFLLDLTPQTVSAHRAPVVAARGDFSCPLWATWR